MRWRGSAACFAHTGPSNGEKEKRERREKERKREKEREREIREWGEVGVGGCEEMCGLSRW